MELELNEMKRSGIIADCEYGSFNSPVFFVRKRTTDGTIKHRIVVNFIKLNTLIVPDRFPVPLIDDMVYKLNNNKIFSTIDLKSGYLQIKINPAHAHRTAFSINHHKLMFLRVPAGIIDGGSSLIRLLNKIMPDLILSNKVFVYIDDLLIASQTTEEHLAALREVLKRLKDAKLLIEPSKCDFMKNSVEFCGFLIKPTHFEPSDRKTLAIKNYQKLSTVKEVRQFLGLCSYFRKFVKDFSTIAHPLNQLLRKNKKFEWNQPAIDSFEKLKSSLISKPILVYPDFNKQFICTTDSSSVALGCVLTQLDENNEEHPIGYASRTLNDAERNYSTFDREFLALLWGIEFFRPFLFGRRFLCFTDCAALVSVLASRLDSGSPRIIRWRQRLLQYDFKICYKKGKSNLVADGLSRIQISPEKVFLIANNVEPSRHFKRCNLTPILQNDSIKVFAVTRNIQKIQDSSAIEKYLTFLEEAKDKASFRKIERKIEETSKKIDFTSECELKVIFISKNQPNFPDEFKLIFHHKILNVNDIHHNKNLFVIVINENQTDKTDEKNLFLNICKLRDLVILQKIDKIHFRIDSSQFSIPYFSFKEMIAFVFKDDKLKITLFTETAEKVLSVDEQKKIIRQIHDSLIGGHSGIQGTIDRIKAHYDFPNVTKLVKEIVKNCKVCQLNKRTVAKEIPLKITTTSTHVGELLAIDHVGPLLETADGNNYLLTCCDNLSRHLVAIPVKAIDAETTCDALIMFYINIFGSPERILCDNGSAFISAIFKEMAKIYNCKVTYLTPYNPQGNYLEIIHQRAKFYLRAFTDHIDKLVKTNQSWDKLISHYCLSYNSKVHSSLGGFSPFEIFFGRKCTMPYQNTKIVDINYCYDDYVKNLKFTLQKLAVEARENQIKKKTERNARVNKNTTEKNFEIGDLVKLLVKHNKIGGKSEAIFSGPFPVVEINSNENITILVKNKNKRYHKNLIFPYYENDALESDHQLRQS